MKIDKSCLGVSATSRPPVPGRWLHDFSVRNAPKNLGYLANQLYEEALRLNMSVIIEVHTKDEAVKSAKFKDALIGINNRNLKTLKTNINTTYDIHTLLVNNSGPIPN